MISTQRQRIAWRYFSPSIGILLLICIGFSQLPASAQPIIKEERNTTIWANAFYGRNNSGLGLGIRYKALGIGATVFQFTGDTTASMPPRPGGVAISIDGYLAFDLVDWFAFYGNAGYVGRLTTNASQRSQLRESPQLDFLSLGAGIQITIASRLMIGGGYNFIIDTPDYQGDPTDDPIQSIVAQLGYRL